MIIDPKDLDPQSVYKLLIGSVVPGPIAWTSTVSKKGIRNLAPFSFFTMASRKSAMLAKKANTYDLEQEVKGRAAKFLR